MYTLLGDVTHRCICVSFQSGAPVSADLSLHVNNFAFLTFECVRTEDEYSIIYSYKYILTYRKYGFRPTDTMNQEIVAHNTKIGEAYGWTLDYLTFTALLHCCAKINSSSLLARTTMKHVIIKCLHCCYLTNDFC